MKKENFNAINAINERERESSSRLVLSPTSQSICHTTIPCHTEGVARSISKDSANNAKSNICHTERSEVSKNENATLQNPLDISVSAKPQYDNLNTLDKVCHTEALAEVSQVESNRDISLSLNMATKNEQHTTPRKSHKSKPKRLALSLITASALTGAALDMVAAQCSWGLDWAHGGDTNNVGYASRVVCEGASTNVNQMFSQGGGYGQPNYYRSTYWYLSGSTTEQTVSTTFHSGRWNTPHFIYRFC